MKQKILVILLGIFIVFILWYYSPVYTRGSVAGKLRSYDSFCSQTFSINKSWMFKFLNASDKAWEHGYLFPCYSFKGDCQHAEEAYQKDLEYKGEKFEKSNPVNGYYYNTMGECYMNAHQDDKAQFIFEEGINDRLSDRNRGYERDLWYLDTMYYNLGLIYAHKGQKDLALEQVEKIRKIIPNNDWYIKKLKNGIEQNFRMVNGQNQSH